MRRRTPLAYLLPNFSVSRPVTVIMILCAILVLGFIANQRLPVALFPEGMDEKNLGVYAPYGNASARDVEEKIARPIEDMIGTVSGVKRMRSTIRNGFTWISVTFQADTDLETAYADLRDRMDRLMPEMPDDFEQIYVRRWDENDIPIMYLVLDMPPSVDDVAHAMQTVVEPALRRIDGVGNIDTHGFRTREVQVDMIEERLRSHRVDPSNLVRMLRDQNFSLSSGFVMEGGSKVYVRSVGRFETIEQIEGIVIDPVHRLTLKDVANVSYQADDQSWMYRVDGEPAIGVEITRESSANIEQISQDVHRTLVELTDHPTVRGMDYSVFWDQGKHVRESIDNLKSTGLWGGSFAALVIFAFLRAPRMTGILTLAIPLSLLCTVIVIYFIGWSLNMATMMGLLLSVGLVVDNAIVIVENIYRKRQRGDDANSAAVNGAGEVGLAVTMATLTTVVVFMPLILMSDDAEFSFWMLRIGMPVVFSLLASLLIALVFIPLATKRFSRGHSHPEPKSIGWLRGRYTRALQWVLGHRIESSLLVLVAFMTISIPMSKVEQSSEGGGDENNSFRVHFYPPSGNTIEDTTAFMDRAEQFVLDRREKYNVDSVSSSFGRGYARMEGRFADNQPTEWYEVVWNNILIGLGQRQPPMTKEDILVDIRENFEVSPGVVMRAGRWGGGGGGNGQGRITIELYGDDTDTLMALVQEAQKRIRSIPETLSVESDMERDGEELRVMINRDRARELGINPRVVSGTIANSLRGREIGRFYTPDGREVDIEVQMQDMEEQDLSDLKAMTFITENGREVPLESVAELEFSQTLNYYRRTDRETNLSVTAIVDRKDTNTVFNKVDEVMEGFQMPAGYRWDKGVRFERLEESNEAQKFAMILSVTLVFLLMGVLFESFILPLAVIIAVPFSFLGVWWALFLTGTDMSMMAMIGMVILIGVVVNNAIVLVDLTNRLRQEGKERIAALLQAGQHRLRPILMTTCTTICGLLPMALGGSEMIGMPYAPMGRAMIGGLMFSTVLTLLIVPLFYILLDDLRNWAGSVAQSALTRPSTSPKATSPRDSSA
jgi:hydrophobic/amphiphilic exporter-1 (mainly G- bacteria), HAE1 family